MKKASEYRNTNVYTKKLNVKNIKSKEMLSII